MKKTIRRITILYLLTILVIPFGISAFAASEDVSEDTIVYITEDEPQHYHTADCSIWHNCIPISLEEAEKKDLRPCKKCKPDSSQDEIFYYTGDDGECYHRSSCSTWSSRKGITLAQADGVYEPCDLCKPPVLEKTEVTVTATPTLTQKPSTSPEVKSESSEEKNDNSLKFYMIATCAFGCAGAFLYKKNRRQAQDIADLQSDNMNLMQENEQYKAQAKEQQTYEATLYTNVNAMTNVNDESEAIDRELLMDAYSGKTINECVGAPADCYVTPEGFPAKRGPGKYGVGYTVYISDRGSKYHCRKGCSSAYTEANILQIGSRTPCPICNPVLPDYSWLPKFKEIQRIKSKYNLQ